MRAWDELDMQRSQGRDRESVTALTSVRAMVFEGVPSSALRETADFWAACASFGRLLAEHGCSTSFASRTLGHLAEAKHCIGEAWVEDARASLIEAYVRERSFQETSAQLDSQGAALLALRGDEFALYAPHVPASHDVQGWADAVVAKALKRGVRSLVVQGAPETVAALHDSAQIGGLVIRDRPSRVWLPFG